jgi:hypothetical protein
VAIRRPLAHSIIRAEFGTGGMTHSSIMDIKGRHIIPIAIPITTTRGIIGTHTHIAITGILTLTIVVIGCLDKENYPAKAKHIFFLRYGDCRAFICTEIPRKHFNLSADYH